MFRISKVKNWNDTYVSFTPLPQILRKCLKCVYFRRIRLPLFLPDQMRRSGDLYANNRFGRGASRWRSRRIPKLRQRQKRHARFQCGDLRFCAGDFWFLKRPVNKWYIIVAFSRLNARRISKNRLLWARRTLWKISSDRWARPDHLIWQVWFFVHD